jgi:hypothetical protein
MIAQNSAAIRPELGLSWGSCMAAGPCRARRLCSNRS